MTLLPKGVFITITPFLDAAGISAWDHGADPPARPITFRLVALSSSFAVTLVAERIARPSC